MSAPARLGLYGVVLVAVFALAAVTAHAVVPAETVQRWTESGSPTDGQGGADHGDDGHSGADNDRGETDAGEHGGRVPDAGSLGLALEQDGFRLTAVHAPDAPNDDGRLSFVITGPDGNPVTDYDLEHEKELHLIVVRADGQHFRHVHPQRAADGTWSLPWTWQAGGTYRLYADFTPTRTGDGVTLSTAVQVAGRYAPVVSEPVRTVSVHGYRVSVAGELVAGESSRLTMQITRAGEPVTTLQPYLGAFGHLVALRDGDLAYLHVHPHGAEPRPGDTSGPEITFEATAPTPGRYLLYLDFRIDGTVHTAPLVIDTVGSAGGATEGEEKQGKEKQGKEHEEDGGHGHGE